MTPLPNDEGSITTVVTATDADWTTNDHEYHFQPVVFGLNRCEISKHSDGLLKVLVSVSGNRKTEFIRPVPLPDENGIHVSAMWSGGKIKLFLNGSLADIKPLPKEALDLPDCSNCEPGPHA